MDDPSYELDPQLGEITELNLINGKIFTYFEQIANKTKNINVHLQIVKMMDIIMANKWYSIADKDTWALIYLVNFIFDIHDIFVGSLIAERLVRNARYILMQLLETRSSNLNQEQSYEINSLLGCEALKGSKVHLSFESDTKEIRDKISAPTLQSKIEGLNLLCEVFGKCYNLQD